MDIVPFGDIYSPVALEQANEEQEVLNSEERPNKRRRKKSIVWEHFTIEAAGPSRMKACCKHCKKSFAYINGPKLAGTSHLKRHISLGICTGGLQKSEVAQIASGTKSDPPKRRYRTSSGYAGIPFNQDRCTSDLAKMIIKHDYPLHIVEHAAFADFVRALHPQYNMVSFNTIQGECVALYLKEKQCLLDQINEIPGRINLTVDLATSNLSIGYAFLTGHFIDRDWNLQKRILNVIMLPFPDSEYAFNQAVVSCMSDWHLENKLFTLTLDSSHLNESIIGNLRGLLPVKNSLLLDGQLLKGNCFARLMSRLAQEAMEKVQDSIRNIRECVKYVKTSDSHDEKFTELRQQLQVPSTRELVIDDGKKWNTTYQMLLAACELKEVFGCLDTADPIYKINPSPDDWKNVEVLCTYLKLFYEAACILTVPSPPPANTFYHEVSKIQSELTHAAASQDQFVSDLTKPLKERFDEYWKDCFLVLAMAVVMDPRFKMKLVEFSFAKVFGENAGSWIKAVDDGIHELFLDYITPPSSALMHPMNGSLEGISMEDQSLDMQNDSQTSHLVDHEIILIPSMEGPGQQFSHFSSHSQDVFCGELHVEEKKIDILHQQGFLPQVVYSGEMMSNDFTTGGVSQFDEMQVDPVKEEYIPRENLVQETIDKNFSPQEIPENENNEEASSSHENSTQEVPVEPIYSHEVPTEELRAEVISVGDAGTDTNLDESVQQETRVSDQTEEVVREEVPAEMIGSKDADHEEANNTQEVTVNPSIQEASAETFPEERGEDPDVEESCQKVDTDEFVSESKQPSQESQFEHQSENIRMQTSSEINTTEVSNQEIHMLHSFGDSQFHVREVTAVTDTNVEEVSHGPASFEGQALSSAKEQSHPEETSIPEQNRDEEAPPKAFSDESKAVGLSSHEMVSADHHEQLSAQGSESQHLMSVEPLPQHFESMEMLVMKNESQQEGDHDDNHHPHDLQNQDVSPQDLSLLSSGDGLSDFEVYITAIGNQHMKSELDQYLEESLMPRVQEFDVLGWWKLNKLKYPTLSQLAADILSIPISTVEPESVFDTSSKKIDSYHGSLHPLTLEAIICAKDWLQNSSPASPDVDMSNSIMKVDY